MTAVDVQPVLLAVIVLAISVAAVALLWILVGSSAIYRRRYLKTREYLGGRLLAAQDEERAAIAREIHDDAIQRLITMAGTCRTADQLALRELPDKIDQLASDLRELSRGLHPTLVDHVGLNAALRDLCVEFSERENMSLDYTTRLPTDAMTPAQRLAFYRVAQEALGNAAQHAGVQRVGMDLGSDAESTYLTITDFGSGFDRHAASRSGIGLTSMKERMNLLGGFLDVESRPGKGTRIRAELPRNA